MRASIVIASHNEGSSLERTIRSCLETTGGLECEVVVADDRSDDGSVAAAREAFPAVRVVGSERRQGVSLAKHRGGVAAAGSTIVFLDAHCKPEPGALERLVAGVEEQDGRAVMTPEVAALDTSSWKNVRAQCGNGYRLDLETLDTEWIPLSRLRTRGAYYESPGLMGCCLAISRDTYHRLRGFDVGMLQWGVEDVDLGLKAWLAGYAVLHDPRSVIGHRFQQAFNHYEVADAHILANGLRLARRSFQESTWQDWVDRARGRHPAATWEEAWQLFERGRGTAEQDREYLLASYAFDEFWYAERFGLKWPFSIGFLLDEPSRTISEMAPDELAAHVARQTRYRGTLERAQIQHRVHDPCGEGCIYLQLRREPGGMVGVESARFETDEPPPTACYLALACHLVSGERLARGRSLSAESLARLLEPTIGTSEPADRVARMLQGALAQV